MKTSFIVNQARSIKGELRVLDEKVRNSQAVELWLLNEDVTANGWRYEKIEEHKKLFADTPILVAYIGKKIGDGHNFEETLSNDGSPAASFMAATAERIVGRFRAEEDIRVENKDGKKWIVGKGYLWAWYARELVDKLKKQGLQGMSVSIETLVHNGRIEKNGVEVYDDYEILGTTILGDDVQPAVAGACIKALSALGSEKVREITLLCASANENGKNQKSKKIEEGEKKRMNLSDIKKALPDCDILAVKDADVILLNGANRIVHTTVEKNGEEVVVGKKTEIALNAAGENGVDVPVEAVIEAMSAKLNRAEAENKTLVEARDAALRSLKAIQDMEHARRKSDVKNALCAEFEKINSTCKTERSCLEELCKDEKIEEYANLECDGKFIGAEAALKDLKAACMDKMTANSACKKTRFAWETPNAENGAGEDENAALMRILE